MFERCFSDKQWKQALGVAVETRRMDMFRRAILGNNYINDCILLN